MRRKDEEEEEKEEETKKVRLLYQMRKYLRKYERTT
jgi:hypothetical protein